MYILSTMEQTSKYFDVINILQSARGAWEVHANECEEYFFSNVEGTNTQYTQAQKQTIEEDYKVSVSINLLYPIIEQMLSFIVGPKPSVRVVPVGEGDKNTAYLCQSLWSAVFYQGYTNEEIKGAIRDSLITGSGFVLVEPSGFYRRNPFNVNITYVPWKYVYVDPNSTRWDYSDAEYILISKSISANKIVNEYGKFGITMEHLKRISSMPLAPTTSGYSIANEIEINELYSKEWIKSEPNEPKFLWKNGQIKDIPEYNEHYPLQSNVYVKKTLLLAKNYKVWEGYLPVKEYPIIHFPCVHYPNGKNGKTYGIIHFLIDPQKAFNNTHSAVILNAQLHGHIKMIAPKGMIDKEEFQQFGSNPKVLMEYESYPDQPQAKPERMMPMPLSNAHYTLFGEYVKFVEYISGIWAVMQGNGAAAPDTFGGTQAMQMYGTQRIKMRASLIDLSIAKLCHCVLNFIIFYSPKGSLFRYIDESNEQILQNPQTGQMEKVQNPPQDEWREINLLYKPDINDFDVVATPNPSTPTTRMLASQLLGVISGQMQDPNISKLFAQYSLKLLDIPEADDINRKVDTIQQMEQQMQQTTQQLQQLQQELQNLSTENERLTKDAIEDKYRHEVEKHAVVAKGEIDIEKEVSKQYISDLTNKAEEELMPDEIN